MHITGLYLNIAVLVLFGLLSQSIYSFHIRNHSGEVISTVASRVSRHHGRNFARYMGNSHPAMSSLRTELESDIKANEVMIYSKTYCPYCTRAKEAIKAQGVNYKIVELDVR